MFFCSFCSGCWKRKLWTESTNLDAKKRRTNLWTGWICSNLNVWSNVIKSSWNKFSTVSTRRSYGKAAKRTSEKQCACLDEQLCRTYVGRCRTPSRVHWEWAADTQGPDKVRSDGVIASPSLLSVFVDTTEPNEEAKQRLWKHPRATVKRLAITINNFIPPRVWRKNFQRRCLSKSERLSQARIL